jgi:hypothetical protein
MVTKDFQNRDFEKLRKKEEDDEYDVDEIKEAICLRKGFVFG